MLYLQTDITKIQLRDFKVASANTNPNNAATFVQGQWWQLDANNVDTIIPVVAGDPAKAFAVWTKRGMGSAQVLSQLAVLFLGPYEAETDQYNAAGTYAIGTELTVANGVLTPVTAAENVHAICMVPPDQNTKRSGYLRYLTVR